MNILIKIFLTYASISMVSGLAYVLVYGTIVGIGQTNLGIFMLLWFGPLGIACSIGLPIGLWHLWISI
jgi:hypothetical protein